MIGNVIVGAGQVDLPAPPTGFEGEVTRIETDGAMPPFKQLRMS